MNVDSKYDKRGVSSAKEDVHAAIRGLDKGLFPNAFCKILPDYSANDPAYCNIMHADTAGTKPSLAYVYWRETGDDSVWKGLIQDAIVMNIDDMACAGAVDNIVLSSTIGRNKYLIPGEVVRNLINGTQEFIERMKALGVNLYLAGGETADVGDIVRTLDVGFTAFARMKRSEAIEVDIRDGDVIVALASFGQAKYESEYNSGMGSNGLTSARHDVFGKYLAHKYPESFSREIDQDLVYAGRKRLTDIEEETGMTYGKLVLSPTRTYTPILKRLIPALKGKLQGLIHVTGGGQTKVMNFVNGMHIIKDDLFEVPPLFRIIKEESGTDWKEMYRVFNMGHRLEVYVKPEFAGRVMDIANDFGVDARIIGRCEASPENKLTVSTLTGVYEY